MIKLAIIWTINIVEPKLMYVHTMPNGVLKDTLES